MKQININTTSRTEIGGNSAKRYRQNGQIPAVVYGESGVKNLLLDEKEFEMIQKQIVGKAVLIELSFSDGSQSCYAMLKDVERHPLTDRVLHIDFIEVVRGKPMNAVLPIRIVGESFGAKNENGIIAIQQHEVRVVCRPRDLPEAIEIDVTPLHIDEAIFLKDIKAPEGVEFIATELENLIVICNPSAAASSAAS